MIAPLPEWVKPGVSFRCFRNRYHVRAFVDGMVVMRYWRSHKQRWEYIVEDDIWFHVNKDHIELRKG